MEFYTFFKSLIFFQAAKTAKAEAVADLAEFDENIPLDQEPEKEPEISKAEQEINNIIEKVTFFFKEFYVKLYQLIIKIISSEI